MLIFSKWGFKDIAAVPQAAFIPSPVLFGWLPDKTAVLSTEWAADQSAVAVFHAENARCADPTR